MWVGFPINWVEKDHFFLSQGSPEAWQVPEQLALVELGLIVIVRSFGELASRNFIISCSGLLPKIPPIDTTCTCSRQHAWWSSQESAIVPIHVLCRFPARDCV